MDDGTAAVERRMVRLLGALVALTAVLVVALAVGGFLAWREVARVRGALARELGGGSARGVLAEVSRKQEAMSSELAAVSRDASRQIAEFDRRAARAREQGGGLIDSGKRAVELSQLMADEMLLQLKLMAALHSALEKATRPLPEQQQLLGEEGHAPQPAARRQGRAEPPAAGR